MYVGNLCSVLVVFLRNTKKCRSCQITTIAIKIIYAFFLECHFMSPFMYSFTIPSTYFFTFTASLPKLVDFDWSVNLRTPDNSQSQVAVPVCCLHLQVQNNDCFNATIHFCLNSVDLMSNCVMISGL